MNALSLAFLSLLLAFQEKTRHPQRSRVHPRLSGEELQAPTVERRGSLRARVPEEQRRAARDRETHPAHRSRRPDVRRRLHGSPAREAGGAGERAPRVENGAPISVGGWSRVRLLRSLAKRQEERTRSRDGSDDHRRRDALPVHHLDSRKRAREGGPGVGRRGRELLSRQGPRPLPRPHRRQELPPASRSPVWMRRSSNFAAESPPPRRSVSTSVRRRRGSRRTSGFART